MNNDTFDNFKFPVGYHRFHKKEIFNFQLNRWHSLGFARFEDMQAVGQKIKTFGDWKTELVKLGDEATAEERYLNAAIYYRAAEFYIINDDAEKEVLYDRFIDLFYRVFQEDKLKRLKVPYKESYLHVIKLACAAGECKGTILMHGGLDSFIEDFYFMMRHYSKLGYDVYAFDGPGQGMTLKRYNIPLDPAWEKPVSAILDHFNLDDVILHGISMGGWLCLRAAAFEPRIKRVIASGVVYDYMLFYGALMKSMHEFFLKNLRDYSNRMLLKTIKKQKSDLQTWMAGNLMYITRKELPMDAFELWAWMSAENLHSDQVTQDVLILTGRHDHFVPFKMHAMQVKALTHARSVTDRVFTKKDQAFSHCQIGNIGLSMDVIHEWLN